MKKELIIDFTDVNVCLRNLKDLRVKISIETKSSIIKYHEGVRLVTEQMPLKYNADIYFRVANKILSLIEEDTDIRFVRYKRCNYELY